MMNSAEQVAKRRRAAIGTSIFMVVAPGTVVGVIPYLITRWQVRPVPGGTPTRVFGVALLTAGVSSLTHSFVKFAREGLGTPAPIAPPEHLVVNGAYRHVRNPMYVAIGSALIGQTLLLGQPKLLGWLAAFEGLAMTFVRHHEEPTLANQHGSEYEEYRRNVPGWIPRLTPWKAPRHQTS